MISTFVRTGFTVLAEEEIRIHRSGRRRNPKYMKYECARLEI